MSTKMNPDVKAEWVAKLRSGEYAQTRDILNRLEADEDNAGNVRPVGHCCLGVLTDIFIKKFPDQLKWDSSYALGCSPREHAVAVSLDFDPDAYHSDMVFEAHELPRPVMEWAGLERSNPYIGTTDPNTGGEESLAGLNDAGKTFAEIADVIEATF